jgi:hypothetical protein
VPAGTDLAAEREKLATRSDVQSVTLDYVYELFEDAPQGAAPKAVTNDAYYNRQWALDRIGFGRLPASVMSTTAPTVAVVDTGVDYNHPDLTGKVTKGPDYVDGDLSPMDETGHGTHVAGIIAATNNNNLGVAGVSGKSAILAVRVGTGYIPTFAAAAGIVYAADAVGVKVMNLSWGGSYDSAIIKDAVAYAVGKNILVVASAGNDDTTDPMYPASYPGVLSVGATGTDDSGDDVKTEFSNYCDTVDIAAPGVDIYSTTPLAKSWYYDPSYDWSDGTSMASPLVAGAAALVRGKWTTMTAQQVADLLIDNGYSPIGPDLDANSFPGDVTRLDVYEAFLAKLVTMPASLGAVYGIIIDANTGLPLGGATVTAKLNGGTSTYTATTRTDGTFTIINMPEGFYTVTASKSTYIATSFGYSRYVYPGYLSGFTYIPLPKVQAADVYTAVLAWGWNENLDLDSYLWLPGTLPDRNKYMVGYTDRGNLNVHPFARFLRDEQGEMPGRRWWPFFAEAIVFRAKYTGTYQFAVYEWTGLGTWGDDAYVVVNLYKGAAFVRQYKVDDATGSGTWWSVFSVTGPTGLPVAVQTLTDAFPGPYGVDEFWLSIERKLALPTKAPAFGAIVPGPFAP